MIDIDPSTMAAHLAWLVEPVHDTHPNMRFEVACGEPDRGPNIGRTFALGEIGDAISFVAWANARGFNCYVGVTLKRADTPAKGRSKTEHAALATALAVDVDGDFANCSRKLIAVAAPTLVVKTGTTPGSRGQIWFRLQPTGDMALWSEVNARSVAFCGGDANALGRYRLMRLAGSVFYPSPAKAARGYVTELTAMLAFPNTPAHDLNDLLARFPAAGNVIRFPRERRAASRGLGDGRRGSIAKAIMCVTVTGRCRSTGSMPRLSRACCWRCPPFMPTAMTRG